MGGQETERLGREDGKTGGWEVGRTRDGGQTHHMCLFDTRAEDFRLALDACWLFLIQYLRLLFTDCFI